MNLNERIKKRIVTLLLFTSLVLSACSKKETSENLISKRKQFVEICTINNIVEFDALQQISDNAFSTSEDIINTLIELDVNILHIGDIYVSHNGGTIEVINYYYEQVREYNGGEIPYGFYLNDKGQLVKNCPPVICYTEDGIAFSLPIDYELKSEKVVEESISYEEFLAYDLDEFLGEEVIKKSFSR